MKIRADIVRTYQTIHTWTGITTGLLLFIGFFAGALIMFSDEIDQWATPPSHQLPQVDASQYQTLLNTVLANEEKAVNSVAIHFSDDHSPITWHEVGNGRGVNVDEQVWHGTLNAQGELVKELGQVNHLSGLLDYLHQTAGIFGEIGHHLFGAYILGVAAFLYFIAIISGLIFLLPTLVKSFFALREKKSASRFWLDTHNLIGVTSLPFHLVIAFTAFVFAYHDFLYGGLTTVYGDKALFEEPARVEVAYELKNLPPLSELITTVENYAPGYQIQSINMSRLNTPAPNASVNIVHAQELMRGPSTDFVFMNPYTLEISTSSVRGGDQGVWVDIVSTIFGLHFGSYGGLLGKWAYFVMGLMGALLFYTGNLLWIEKRRKQKQAQQTRSSTILAKLTVGISLGCITGVSLAFATTKWLTTFAVNINLAYMWLYYLAFFCVLINAFIFGAAKTAIYSLRASALLCLLVPLNSVLAMLLPDLGLWPANNATSIVLEGTALLFAAVFYVVANKVQLRAHQGEQNSVWYNGANSKDTLVNNDAQEVSA